jgi:hypothetical protein
MVLKNNSPEATSRGMRARSTNGFRSARDFVSDREDAMSSSARCQRPARRKYCTLQRDFCKKLSAAFSFASSDAIRRE